MTIEEFHRFVAEKSPNISNLELQKMALMGLAGETGELIDQFKKHYYYSKELDNNNVLEEMGDILHYLTMLANSSGTSLEEIIDLNVSKLNKRYPNGFSKKDAISRKDKK